jgi:16S rRNA (cytosine967-C5)-methyltransferase
MRKIQAEVLESYSKIVKPGGKMFICCSILPSENQDQIAKFLATDIGKEFNFVKDQKILASESGFDGFYMALLERKEEILKPKEIKKQKQHRARIITIIYTQNVFI